MLVRKYMTSDPLTANPETTLSEAAKIMHTRDIGFLPIAKGNHILGVLTDRDIVMRALAVGKDPRFTTTADVMTKRSIYCYAEEDLEDAAEIMEENQVRRLLVLDWNKQLVGILSLGDLSHGSEDESLPGEVVKYVTSPTVGSQKKAA